MTRSEWTCNACGEGFETRGRRDGHSQRAHPQRMLVGSEDRRLKRSENGKFLCECGKDYLWPRSLRRHRRNCNSVKQTEDKETNDDDDDDDDEGMGSIDENELIVRNRRNNDSR
jgi:hypothetical protein